MPLFSTILPTYNRRDLLQRTLQTVLSQDATEPQVIVVDDGSTDGTIEWLATLSSRVQTLRQSNGGPGAARNLGLTVAQGEYVAFLDSDDLWFPWTLATYRRAVEQYNRPAFIAGRPLWFSDESELSQAKAADLEVEVFPDYYASGDRWRWCGASSFVMRRDAVTAAGGFALDAGNSEDHDLTLKLGVAPGFVQITSPYTFGYREHPGNLTLNSDKRYRGLCKWIEQETSGGYPGGEARRKERWRILSRHSRTGCLSLLGAGRPELAWDVYRRTFAWHLSQRRARFLLALPAMLAMNRFKGKNQTGK